MIFDPWSPEVLADPYPSYRRLRDESPCHHVAGAGVYVISRYHDVARVLREPETFLSGRGVGFEPGSFGSLIDTDPPVHTRLRRAVSRIFLPRQVAELRPRVDEVVDRFVDQALDAGRLDLMESVAEPLTIFVMAELLGVPGEQREDFKRWSDGGFEYLSCGDPASMGRLGASVAEGFAYFGRIVEDRRAKGRSSPPDIIDALMEPSPDGDALTGIEIQVLCLSLLAAGNETTTGLIGNGILALVEHPAEWERLSRDPGLVAAGVEEMLRYDAPIQAFFRRTAMDAEVAGVGIPAGSSVLVSYGSANRDERRYPDPDRFMVERNPTDHLAFGAGIHRCVGAALARLEAAAFFTRLVERTRRIDLDGDVLRQSNVVLRGVRHLPVRIWAR